MILFNSSIEGGVIMNFVFISPHFPKNYEGFVVRMNQKGIRVLGIADVHYDELSEIIKENLTEYYRVNNLENYDEVLKACGYFTHKYGKIDRIESFNEHWLELDAALRTDFNVFGLNNDDIEIVKRKSSMKEVFRSAGIKVARGRVFKNIDEAREIIEEVGYPVCAKPDIGVGAGNTYKIKNDEELIKFFKLGHNEEFIMEEFIDGEIVTYDGLTNRNADKVFNSTLVYNSTVLDIVRYNMDMYYYIPRSIPEDVVEAGEKIVKAFDLREKFFHIEFFKEAKTGDLVALEINCRVPGGRTTDMFNFANDIDIYDLYAGLMIDNMFNANITRPYYCAYVGRKNFRNYANTIEDLYYRYTEEIMLIDSIPGVFAAVMGDIGVIFRTKEEEYMFKMLDEILKTRGE